jgi:TonB family protein
MLNPTKINLSVALLFVFLTPVLGQDDWKKIAPVGESFTVSMPTAATVVSRVIPLNEESWVPERVYYSITNNRRYMIVSFSRTRPDQTPALSSFTGFTRVMERSFVSKDNEIRSLTFEQNLSDESGVVKQYHLQLGDYRGVAQFIGVEKNFYALMVIGADETDANVRRFLNSFELGPINDSSASDNVETIDGNGPAIPPEPWPKPFTYISGGVLNGKALSLITPQYPEAARANHEAGQVKVRIVIDEFGKVITAGGVEGPDSLRDAAVDAAFKSRFTPTKLMGQPIKASGVLVYNFVAR